VIAATSNEGAIITMAFPSGAVGSALDVTLRPQSPGSGRWVNILMEPKNMVFFDEVSIAVKAPNEFLIDDSHLLFLGAKSDPALLPSGFVDTSQTLSTTIRGFGVSADDVGFVQRAAAAAGELNNNISAASFSCAEHAQLAQQALDDFIAVGTYDSAAKAMWAAASAVARQGCTELDTWVTITRQLACDSLANATTAAGGASGLRSSLSRVVYWSAIARVLDPNCAALTSVPGLVDSKITDFLASFNTELGLLTDQDFTAFADIKDEARDAHKLFTEALLLGESGASTKLQDDALFPALDALRSAAFTLCQGDTWHYPLSRLSSVAFFAERDVPGTPAPNNPAITESSVYGPFTDQAIWDDIQLCATNLNVSTTAISGGQFDQASGGGGGSPGSPSPDVVIRTASRGEMTIGGGIAGFTCWDDLKADNELQFEVNGRIVRAITRTGEDYLSPPLVLDMKQVAAQSGVPLLDGTRVAMTIRRVRNRCDERIWGPQQFEVAHIQMDIEGPDSLVVTDDLPATATAGDTIQLEVKVDVYDQLSVKSTEDGVDVTVSLFSPTLITTVSPPSGQTDGNGVFNTTIIIAPDAPLSRVASNLAAADLFVTITASMDGVSRRKDIPLNVASCVNGGDVVVNSQEELDAIAGVCHIERSLQLGHEGVGTRIHDLSPLSSLKYAGSGIAITNTDITDLAGLQNLVISEDASLVFSDNPNLTSLDSLASISGESSITSLAFVSATNNPSLTSLSGLNNIIPVGASAFVLSIEDNDALTSLDGLLPIISVGFEFTIRNNDALTSLDGAAVLSQAATIVIEGNALLTSLTELNNVSVSDSLSIIDNAELANLDGLGVVTALTAGCEIASNPLLNNIDGLGNLVTVGGFFAIRNNPMLCTLPSWVGAVTSVGSDHSNNGTDPSCTP